MLPHATTGLMQMTRIAGLACKPRAVVNLGNMDDVLRIVLKIQHNDQFQPTSNQTIVVPPGHAKTCVDTKMWRCDQHIASRKDLLRVSPEISLASNTGSVGFGTKGMPVNLTIQLTRRK